MDENVDEEMLSLFYEKVLRGESVEIIPTATQLSFFETAN